MEIGKHTGVGSVVSPFRRIHKNILMANYNSLAAVLLDDAASRYLLYDNVFAYGQWGVGESCHESQWVYGVGNLYEYTTANNCISTYLPGQKKCFTMISSEGPSPTGIRSFFYNNTMLNPADTDVSDAAAADPNTPADADASPVRLSGTATAIGRCST